MAKIVDALGREWDASFFRDYELYEHGWPGLRNRYTIMGVSIRPQGKVRLLYVDTVFEYSHMVSVIKSRGRVVGKIDLIDELEEFRGYARGGLVSHDLASLKKRAEGEEIVVNPCEFGFCDSCGYEFNSELISEYNIRHCPMCGRKLEEEANADQ